MPRRSTHPIALALSLMLPMTLIACASDTVLRTAPPFDSTEEGSSRGGRGGGGWPGLPDLPGGPWSEIDPGEMPDVYFVIAYGDPDCCYNCDGSYTEASDPGPDAQDGDGSPNGSDADFGFGCEVRYALVDLFGQVIDDFAPPEQGNGVVYSHLDILPSGPGRFMATTEGWRDAYMPNQTIGDEGEEGAPVLPNDENWSWLPWIAWEFDAVMGTSENVAWQDPMDHQVVIPETGKRIDAGVYGVFAAIDPVEPDWLYLHGARAGCGVQPMPLRATHRRNPMILDRFWSAEELVGSEYAEDNVYPTGLAASVDEEGLTHVGLGLGDMGCGGAPQSTHLFVDFIPGEGTAWMRASSESWAANPMTWAPWNGGAAVQVSSPYELPMWHMIDMMSERSGLAPGLDYNVRPGPMLDPAGPTFALLGASYEAPWSDRLVVVHGEDEVWSIDRLRFGLQEREVAMLDVIVLPPLDVE